MRRALLSAREKLVELRPDELRAVALAFVCNFVILASYYVVRPIRDDIGAAGGLENLPWMYTGTLVAMLVANAAFSKLVARFSRRRFIPIAYRFFIANLILFYFAMRFLPITRQLWIGRAFFVWVSVFNLFIATLFWAFMTDVSTPSRRNGCSGHRRRRVTRGDSRRRAHGRAREAHWQRKPSHRVGAHARDRRSMRPVFSHANPTGRQWARGRAERRGDYRRRRLVGNDARVSVSLLAWDLRVPAPLHDHFDVRLFSASRHHRSSVSRSRRAPPFSRNSICR